MDTDQDPMEMKTDLNPVELNLDLDPIRIWIGCLWARIRQNDVDPTWSGSTTPTKMYQTKNLIWGSETKKFEKDTFRSCVSAWRNHWHFFGTSSHNVDVPMHYET